MEKIQRKLKPKAEPKVPLYDPNKRYTLADRVPRNRPCIKFKTHTSKQSALAEIHFRKLDPRRYETVFCTCCGRFHLVPEKLMYVHLPR